MPKRGCKEKRLAATKGQCYIIRLERYLKQNNLILSFNIWRALYNESTRQLQRTLNILSYRLALRTAHMSRLTSTFMIWRDLCYTRLRKIPPPPGLSLQPKLRTYELTYDFNGTTYRFMLGCVSICVVNVSNAFFDTTGI